ncbi:NAD-dependent epimerase/dehydratase family protein [Microbacterium tumbae]
MTDVLVLGGTGWLSRRIAQRWADAGARVTCLARGGRTAPDGVELVLGDRDDQAVYDALRRDWDEVVDVSSLAGHVRDGIRMLGERSARWTYVSSVSVYADDTAIGADESASLHPAARDDEDDYAGQKVAAEQAVAGLGSRARIVRPGLIAGPGDPSDRFGYWGAAFARSGGGAVLTPTRRERWAQVVDVDDLAEFVVRDRGHGIVDAVGDPHPFGAVIDAFRSAAEHTGRIVEAGDAWLEERGVQHWMGERSLPLWLPADMPGFARRSSTAYRAAGGPLRPLAETISRVLLDERSRGVGRPRRSGLTREEELALLTAIDA